jgi:replicative DNA helicase
MGEKEITNILNLRNESPETIRLIAASTPCGKRGSYYKWCTQASVTYTAIVDAININYKVRFNKTDKPKGEGNGWIQFYAPSTVNKELLKINPDTGQSYIDDFRDELTEERFEQEVMALFGNEALGVFNKDYIDYAFAAGKYQKYYNRMSISERVEWKKRHVLHKKIFGIDWDRVSAGPSLVGVLFDESGFKFKVFLRIELPRTEFTYIDAVNEIIKWNKEIDPDWIYMDRGAGDVQFEMFQKYGRQYPESGLQKKVVANSLAEKTNIFDIFTRKRVKHPLKPTMINNAVLVFERKAILIPKDKKLKTQLEEYKIKHITQGGVPVYQDGNDHFVDALARALFGFAKQYDELFKITVSTKIKYIDGVDVSQKRPGLASENNKEPDIIAHDEIIMREVFKNAEHNPFDPEYMEEKATGTYGRGQIKHKVPKRRTWRS